MDAVLIEQFVISGVEANAAGKKHHVAIMEFTEILMAGSAKRRTKVQGPMKRRLGPPSPSAQLHRLRAPFTHRLRAPFTEKPLSRL